jgi:hypothetical protein
MTATAERNGTTPFALSPGTRLLGEIISWSASGVSVKHADLILALRECGLDESVARELAPRHAFARACKKLGERRIIRAVSETATELKFQFTQESRSGDRYEYTLETLLTLEKATGKVSCSLPGLATLSQERLDECIASRNGSDVTRLIQRLFDRNADLFAVRDKGGVYFVPERHAAFLDKISELVTRLNGSLRRFPVPAGTPHGDRSVKEAVASGLEAIIDEHRKAVANFGEDTRDGTLQRAAERIREARFKVEAYSTYLAEERGRLEKCLEQAASELRLKVESLATSREGVTP